MHRLLKQGGFNVKKITQVLKDNPTIANLATERSSMTHLHICVMSPTPLGFFLGYIETENELIRLGADLNAQDKEGKTPLKLIENLLKEKILDEPEEVISRNTTTNKSFTNHDFATE